MFEKLTEWPPEEVLVQANYIFSLMAHGEDKEEKIRFAE